jgi:hypothetical protein
LEQLIILRYLMPEQNPVMKIIKKIRVTNHLHLLFYVSCIIKDEIKPIIPGPA